MPKKDADPTVSTERKTRGVPFAPGNNANPSGRPKGSRNKLGEAFLAALNEDFQAHGVAAIEKVRTEKPEHYLKVIASILPKQVEIKEGAFDGVSDEELAALVAAARSALGVAGSSAKGDGDQTGAKPARSVPTLQ